MDLIELRNITKTYFLGEVDVPVLKGITLNIKKGEYVALMGASGSGKSTLMNILGCLDRPTAGDYFFEGSELGRASGNQRAAVRNQRIGFVFQSFNLLPRTAALENVIMPLSYTAGNLSHRQMVERGKKALHDVGLESRMHHHPSQLSGGQQQRVAIARALANEPQLLLADEPTAALDSIMGRRVMELLKQVAHEHHTGVLVVTHDHRAMDVFDRIWVMEDGRIKEQ
jgi:ABC-type lipoprotein export system ATPase subunit